MGDKSCSKWAIKPIQNSIEINTGMKRVTFFMEGKFASKVWCESEKMPKTHLYVLTCIYISHLFPSFFFSKKLILIESFLWLWAAFEMETSEILYRHVYAMCRMIRLGWLALAWNWLLTAVIERFWTFRDSAKLLMRKWENDKSYKPELAYFL